MNNKTIPRRFNISSAEMALIVTVIIGVLVNSSQFATVDNAYNIVRQFVTNAIIAFDIFVPSRKDYIAKFQNQNPGVEVTFIK